MKMKLLSLILLMLFLLPAKSFSQEWVEFTEDSNGNKFFLKSEITSYDGDGIIRLWIKKIWKKYTLVNNGKTKEYKDVVIMDLVDFDCNNSRYKLVTSTVYDSTGSKIILQDHVNEYLEDWEHSVPESVGDSLLSFVCGILD